LPSTADDHLVTKWLPVSARLLGLLCRATDVEVEGLQQCCAGFVLVKKVPGTMHFLAKSPGHSFDFHAMNMSHAVHHYYFGAQPSSYH